MDNRDISKLFLRRDEAAITEIDLKYRKYLLKIAMNILGNKEDAEECLNDTYSAAWSSIKTKAPDDLKLYLARIIKNKALHVVEKNSAEKRGGGQENLALDELDSVASSLGNPENQVMLQNDSRIIEEFLDTLPVLDRNIFVRRYWFYEKLKDISDRYDITQLSVKVRLNSCRRKLRKYLTEHRYES